MYVHLRTSVAFLFFLFVRLEDSTESSNLFILSSINSFCAEFCGAVLLRPCALASGRRGCKGEKCHLPPQQRQRQGAQHFASYLNLLSCGLACACGWAHKQSETSLKDIFVNIDVHAAYLNAYMFAYALKRIFECICVGICA